MGKKKDPGISDAVLCAEYEAVYRYALALCPAETDAQDVTQETFLKAMGARNTFAGQSSPYTWLCAIAKNVWRNRCKKLGREAPLEEAPETADGTERTAEARDGYLALHQAIHALPEPYREVFSLRAMGELSFAEIAGLFGRTESWARVTYHRARKSIRERLEKEERYE